LLAAKALATDNSYVKPGTDYNSSHKQLLHDNNISVRGFRQGESTTRR